MKAYFDIFGNLLSGGVSFDVREGVRIRGLSIYFMRSLNHHDLSSIYLGILWYPF